jgi:Domain of unknown function (DUF4352)
MRARVAVSLLVLGVVAVAQAEAATTTPSPTPSFVSKGTESPTPRPKLTTPTPDFQATIDALKTRVAEASTPTPGPTSTRTPTPTATPTLSPYEKYPPNVAEVAAQDSPYLCDRIGWQSPDDSATYQANSRHYAACGATVSVSVFCEKSTRAGTSALPAPTNGWEWVYCGTAILNNDIVPIPVGPSDFHLVDADNLRYGTVDEDYLDVFLPSGILHDDNVPAGQETTGIVVFDVPATTNEPVRVEVEVHSLTDSALPLVFIIEELQEEPGVGY